MSGGIYTTDKSLDTIISLSDVSTDNLQDNEVLLYNATTEQWQNGAVGGGGGATEILETTNLVAKLGTSGDNLVVGATNNILLGEDCGDGITTNDNNILVGKNILRTGNGQRNILLGENVGVKTTGGYNVCLGFDIGTDINNGISNSNNVMIGKLVGGNRVVGSDNVFIGTDVSRYPNNSINNNVMIGKQAGSGCETGNNVMLGYGAGQNNYSGAFNTSLGYRAGLANNSNRTVNIGSEAGFSRTSGEDHAICIGTETGKARSGEHSIQIGYRANHNTPTPYQRVIVLNATGTALDSTASDTCKIAPIRGVAHGLGVGVMKYDPATSELTYSTN
jgi:hypothetical protein